MDARVSLRRLFPKSRIVGGEDLEVNRLVYDPQDCQAGDLVVIPVGCDDPTETACEALARGAGGLLTEQLLPVPLPQCIVRNADKAAVRICNRLFDRPQESLLTIGVVGGNGKTTTALLIANLLRSQGVRTAYDTDLGTCDGIVQTVKDSRPRDVGAVTEFLAEARDAGAIVAVLELSESFVRSSAFCPLSFDLLVLTGGKQINGNGGLAVSAEDLALERLREGGVAVVNADCPLAMAAADRAACPTLTFAMRTAAAIEAKVFDQQPGETTLMVTAGDTTAVLESTLTGPAMASCQLAAISLGLLMEYSLASVISSVSKLREVPGRVQRIVEFNRPAVVLDVCGSADRLGAVLRGLRRERNGGKLWVVAAVDTDLPASDTAEMGRIAERYADHVVVTTHPEQKSGFLGTAHDWLDGVSRPAAPRFIADRNSAFEWVIGRAESIDTVIIAGGWTVGSPAKQRAEIAADEKFLRRLLCNEDDFDAENPVILPFTASK